MKKLTALVLALALVLCAVSALAATGSVKVDDKTNANVTPNNNNNNNNNAATAVATAPALGKAEANDNINQIIASLGSIQGPDALNAFFGLTGNDVLPANYTTVNEAQPFKFASDPTQFTALSVTLTFLTKYAPQEVVYIMIGIPGATVADTQWIKVAGQANANGDVVIVLTADILQKIGTKTFLAVAVSETK